MRFQTCEVRRWLNWPQNQSRRILITIPRDISFKQDDSDEESVMSSCSYDIKLRVLFNDQTRLQDDF